MAQQAIFDLCGFDQTVRDLARTYGLSLHSLGDWFSSVDFEALTPDITCMAANAAASVGFADVPQALAPRLRGLIKYVHTLNAGMVAGLCALGAALNKAGIPVLLLEDTALYLSSPDGPQRQLWQMRTAVRRQDYARALDAVRQAGWAVEEFPLAAVARQGVTRQISITPVYEGSYLWQGTARLKKGSASFLCPESAAILVGLCQSAFRSLTKPEPRSTVIRWSMDMKLLLSRLTEADWHRAAQIAQKEHAAKHMTLLLQVYEAISGICVPQKALFGTEQDVQHMLTLLGRLRACPEKGHRARRVFLLCRLRRPDSIAHAAACFLREALRKVGI